jgi:predicted kinase
MNREQLKILVEEVSEEMLDEVSILKNKNPFKVLYMLGPAGAGKTFIVNNILRLPSNFTVSNSDEAVEKVFPAFDISLKFASAEENPELERKQQAARKILQSATADHLTNKMFTAAPLVIDTTGENFEKNAPKIKAFTKLGYDVGIVMVAVPEDLSSAANAARKRKVDDELVRKINRDFMKNYSKYASAFKSDPNVTLINEEPYMNLYDLRDFSLRPEVSPEMEAELDSSKDKAKRALLTMKDNLDSFLTEEPNNETGKTLLNAMRALVKATGGRKGQNLGDLAQAHTFKEYPEIFENPDIVQGMIKMTTDPSIKKNVVDTMSRKTPDTTIRALTSDDE